MSNDRRNLFTISLPLSGVMEDCSIDEV